MRTARRTRSIIRLSVPPVPITAAPDRWTLDEEACCSLYLLSVVHMPMTEGTIVRKSSGNQPDM